MPMVSPVPPLCGKAYAVEMALGIRPVGLAVAKFGLTTCRARHATRPNFGGGHAGIVVGTLLPASAVPADTRCGTIPTIAPQSPTAAPQSRSAKTRATSRIPIPHLSPQDRFPDGHYPKRSKPHCTTAPRRCIGGRGPKPVCTPAHSAELRRILLIHSFRTLSSPYPLGTTPANRRPICRRRSGAPRNGFAAMPDLVRHRSRLQPGRIERWRSGHDERQRVALFFPQGTQTRRPADGSARGWTSQEAEERSCRGAEPAEPLSPSPGSVLPLLSVAR